MTLYLSKPKQDKLKGISGKQLYLVATKGDKYLTKETTKGILLMHTGSSISEFKVRSLREDEIEELALQEVLDTIPKIEYQDTLGLNCIDW